jgi:hypothetical protein
MTWRSDIMDAIVQKPREAQRGDFAALVRDNLREYPGASASVAIYSYSYEITLALGYTGTGHFAAAHGIALHRGSYDSSYDNKLADLLVEEARLRKIPEISEEAP